MLKSDELLKMFERMRDEHWSYVWGAAKEGTVDCSGAFVWAFDQYGLSIPHGSNTIGRKNVESLLPISEAKPGMAVFRCKSWGDSKDDKDNRYYNDTPGNLSHIGLVGRDGKTVLHASGQKTGFVESKLNSTWAYVGRLKNVNYAESNQNDSDFGTAADMSYGVISITSGYVNLRSKPTVTSKVLAHMSRQESVEILGKETSGKWLKVLYKGIEGYAYAKYIAQNTISTDQYDPIEIPLPEAQNVTIVDSAGNRFEPVGDFTVLFGTVD